MLMVFIAFVPIWGN